jgi:2-iminoacetate synthase
MKGDLLEWLRTTVDPAQADIALVEQILGRASASHPMSVDDSCALLGIDPGADPTAFGLILSTARRIKHELFEGQVFAIVPVYVSSVCQEHCLYCNYRAGNKAREITRLRLTDQELHDELAFLTRKGYRVLELVYATDPRVTLDDVVRHVTIAKEVLAECGGGNVGINARPYRTSEYARLAEAGIDFAVIWQETYDEDAYRDLHPGNTEKNNFAFRVGAPARMLEGGIKRIGLGVLSGLSGWRSDWTRLMRHVKYIEETYSDRAEGFIFGIPRLKPAAGALLQKTPHIPDDREMLLAISAVNLFRPDALPFVNTREDWKTCLALAEGGGTLFTLNCRTIPGGYAHNQAGYQFPTFDFSPGEHVGDLKAHGIKPIFAWDFASVRKERLVAEALST